MAFLREHGGLYTDFYELTMAQAYFLNGKADEKAVFDYFFRKNPFEGGYVVFAGLGALLDELKNFIFHDDDIEFLRQQGFHEEFLDYLKKFSFQGAIIAPYEGEVVFPLETVIRIEGNLMETQLVETMLLNIINFSSLVATKASRIRRVAGDRMFSDFGLRRAQTLGGIHGSRAAYIGGADSTSNVLAGQAFGIPVSGTQAHSWVLSFESELESFRSFAAIYPDKCILLVDTFDTLGQGIPNAIIVGQELAAQGHRLAGIRLDSGDLAYLSKKARVMLDEAGFHDAKIYVSNQLDEYLIRSLNTQKAPIDGFGVGTELITGRPTAALDGVYKLAELNGAPRVKISENILKTTLPGNKTVYRFFDDEGSFYADAIALSGDDIPVLMQHPYYPEKQLDLSGLKNEKLLHYWMKDGLFVREIPSLSDVAAYARSRIKLLPDEHRRIDNPHTFKVGVTPQLATLRSDLLKNKMI